MQKGGGGGECTSCTSLFENTTTKRQAHTYVGKKVETNQDPITFPLIFSLHFVLHAITILVFSTNIFVRAHSDV